MGLRAFLYIYWPSGFPLLLKVFVHLLTELSVFFTLICRSWFFIGKSFIICVYCNYLLSVCGLPITLRYAFKKRLFSRDYKIITTNTQKLILGTATGDGKRVLGEKLYFSLYPLVLCFYYYLHETKKAPI